MYLICSDSPIWDRDRKLFSTCFENMVLGFGPNLVTIFMIIVLGYKMRGYQESRVTRTRILMVFLLLVPIFGACASFFNISLLIKDSLHGHISKYHHWFISCSEFVLWMIVVLFIRCDYWSLIFCNPVFCFWWIMKVLLEVSHVFTIFSSSQAIRSFTEGFSISAEFMFVIFINLVRIMSLPIEIRNFDSLEEALLPNAEASEIHINKKKIGFLGYFHTLTFKVVNPMMDLGVTRQLNFQDLIEPPTELMPSSCFSIFLKFWEAEYGKNGQNASLIKVIFHAYGWPYLRVGLLKALNDVMNFIGPLILNRLIWFLQQGSGHFDGYTLAILLGLSSIVKSFLDTQYSFNLMKLKLKMRASIMAVIYRKCLQVSIAERSKFSDGEIQTFMSIDVDRTINLCNSFHDMWSLPLQIGLALFLLYTQVKFAFLSGLIITVLLIPVNKWICTLIGKASKKMMAQKDERIKSVGELLSHIRTVKMYSWEYFMANRIMEKRAKEVEHLGTRKYLDAWCVFFWATTPTLFSLFTFGVFTLMGHPLDAATVFTCVALFNTLISPLNSFPWVINGLIDAFISTGRLSKFLSCTEYTSQLKLHSTEYEHKTIPNVEMAIVFSEADCIWSSSEDIGNNIFLKKINLDLPKGFFIVVIGEIGSGKSSLLYSVLREMCQIQGYIDFHGSLAYVSQIPWIMSGTVRDNILFGKEYNARRYGDVLKACSLDDDISLMIGGDMAYIGEKGTNLSGGQRTRIALARALYCGSDVFLLDDILSAVDAHVGSWILHKAILGPLMRPKTCVLCTHSSQAISAADMVVLMDKGSVKWAGCLDNFIESPYSTIFMENDQNSTQALEQSLSNSACSSGEINHIISPDGEYIVVSEEAHENIEIEMRKEGKVELGAYKCYMKFCSWPIVTVICISAVLMQASRNGNDMWLSFWVDTTSGTKDSAEFYLVILCIFCVINSLLTLIRAFSFSYGGLRAAIEVHSNFLKNLINAPVHFFSQNPSGRILNRLSSDLYTIDDSLPFILNILLANFFNLLGIAIVLSYVQVLFVILLLPFWYIYQKIQFYYRSTSRELRRLDSISRSPIYSLFSEILDGSPTIRAFKAEELFMSGFIDHVTSYQQTSYCELTTSLWLSLRLQLLAAVIISCIALLSVFGCCGNFSIKFGTPGLIGLALSYAAPIVSLLSSFLSSFTETEKEMVSIERVLEYMDIPQEEFEGFHSPYPAWPTQGEIKFENVTLRYMPSFPTALKNISFKISAGTMVGVVGRTGAGKSSILNALFRLTPICNGRIIVDGINISDFVARDFRSHLAVVPQSPFLFEGSLRDNLDPSGFTSDLKMWDVLEKCHVKDDVEAVGGLDVHVKESGISFSVGQRQLICLARALIKSSKILCLDECTANVDAATTSILHNTISDECKGMTVLTIAHRISVVKNMDNILILDHGVLVEQGNPQTLMKDELSVFSSFARASTV